MKSSTELSPDGRRQGQHVEFDLTTGKRRVEGTYSDDEPTGVWTHDGENGQIEMQRNEGEP